MNAVIADRYRLEAAFPPSDAQRERAIGMWMQEQVFPDLQQATRRAEQLVVLLNRDDGGLAGVATAADVFAPMAKCRVWMYRTFLRPADRRSLAAFHVLDEAFRVLERNTPQGGPCGVFLNTENLRLKRPGVERRFARMGWHYLGINPRGQATWLRRFAAH